MYILGHIAGGKWTGLNISLCAVNLAEACGDSMSMVQLAEVYATSLIQKSYEGQKKKLYTEFCVKTQEMRLTNGSA
jgi:hypothetical protein